MFSPSIVLPAVDSASISGVESINLIIAAPALRAEVISGTNENILPACIAPNVVLYGRMLSARNQECAGTHHNSDEERLGADFQVRDESCAIPKD